MLSRPIFLRNAPSFFLPHTNKANLANSQQFSERGFRSLNTLDFRFFGPRQPGCEFIPGLSPDRRHMNLNNARLAHCWKGGYQRS